MLLAALVAVSPPAAGREVLAPEAPRQRHDLVVPQDEDPFWPSQLLHGTRSSAERCAAIGGAVWAAARDGGAECIRTFAHGLAEDANPEVLVYIHGDFLVRNRKGEIWAAPNYSRRSPSVLLKEAKDWAEQAGLPAVVLGRPGVYGSSGDHKDKATAREVALIDAALDELKHRHGITRFHLAGQSGGGHSVAALLARRADIGCAVMSSGAVAVDERYRLLKRPAPEGLYDPVTEVARIPRTPRIFLLADIADKRVPYASQQHYLEKLRERGLTPVQILLQAKDKYHHGLSEPGRRAAALCAKGLGNEEIVRQLTETQTIPP